MLMGIPVLTWLLFSSRRWPLPQKITAIQVWTAAVFFALISPLNIWIYPQMGMARPWPMHLCDWSAITAAIALLTRRQIFVELTYFWALAGATNALLTPDICEGFPHPRFIVFFTHHVGLVVVAIWLTVGLKIYPRKNAMWRVFAWSQLFLIVAFFVNRISGHNYGYLVSKPPGTLLDHFGPWPWYILAMEILAVTFFAVLNVPWMLRRRFAKAENP